MPRVNNGLPPQPSKSCANTKNRTGPKVDDLLSRQLFPLRSAKKKLFRAKTFFLEIDQPQVVVRRQRRIGQFTDVMTEAAQAHVLLAHRHQPTDVIVGLVVEHNAWILLADEVRYREERRADAHHECTCKNDKSNHDLIEAIYRAWPQNAAAARLRWSARLSSSANNSSRVCPHIMDNENFPNLLSLD